MATEVPPFICHPSPSSSSFHHPPALAVPLEWGLAGAMLSPGLAG